MRCRSMKRMVSAAFSTALMVISLAAVTFAAPAPIVEVQGPLTEGIRSPLRIAADSTGIGYVTDSLAGGVLKFDTFGHMTGMVKTAKPAQGIALLNDGTLLVGEGDSVAMYDASGVETGRLGSGAGQFKMANGITVDNDGTIYVVDSLDNCVQVFNAAGAYVRRFGIFGTAAGKFSTPTGIAYEKVSGQVAVADTRNGRVQFFDKSGVWKRTVGAFGSGPLRFSAPQGVSFEYTGGATPALKRMYVVDTFQSQVQVIDMAATPVFLSYIGGYGSSNGKLMVPSDVLFDQANGRLLVVNGYGNVTVYGIDGGGIPIDTTPPALTIDPLLPVVYAPGIDLSGTVEAGATVTVTAGGSVTVGAVSYPTSGTWRATLGGFAPGSTSITVTALDAARNAATQTAAVTYLQPAPRLSLDASPALTGEASLQLAGTVEPGCTVTVTNTTTGVSAKATVFGDSWSQRVPLVAGANALRVVAERPLSAAATAAVNVVLDTVAPSITVSALADGSYTSEQVQNLQIAVSDANLDAVFVNGQPVILVNGGFSTAISLNAGANVVTVTASDLAGNVTTDIRTITYDATRPVVTFTAPADGVYVTTDRVTVSGTLDQAATVTVAGIPAVMSGTGWSADVQLAPGINTIDVVAVDLAGNVTSVKRTVTYDIDTPALVIAIPAQDAAVNQASVGLAGSVTDSGPVTVTATVNGVPVPVTYAEGSFSLTEVFADEGAYSIAITATDAAGNAGTATRTLIYDTTPPTLTLDTVNTPYPARLSGTVESGAAVAVEDKDGAVGEVTLTGDTWSAALTLGTYDPDSLAVRATDAAGNNTVKLLVVQVPDGDLSGDGRVTIQDALLALRIFTKQMTPTAAHLARGDIGPLVKGKARPNGVIDLVDALLVLRKALGMQSW